MSPNGKPDNVGPPDTHPTPPNPTAEEPKKIREAVLAAVANVRATTPSTKQPNSNEPSPEVALSGVPGAVPVYFTGSGRLSFNDKRFVVIRRE